MVILVNGCSSAGKSSVVKALREASENPYFLMTLDTFLEGVLPLKCNFENPQDFDMMLKAIGGFHQSVGALARVVDFLVVDHVLQFPQWKTELFEALRGQEVFFVGLLPPLAVLESRESQRLDRQKGTAKSQFEVIQSYTYDMVLDSSQLTPQEAARHILNKVE